MLIRPVALNAGTTYGVDHSAENNFGLGPSYQSPKQQLRAAKAAKATTPTLSVWAIAALILAGVILL